MSRVKKLTYNLPIIVLAIMILFTAVVSVKFVYAGGGSFKEKISENWEDYYNKLPASKNDTYPYDNPGTQVPGAPSGITYGGATITSVSLDVLYGTKRNLVFYHGELPYDIIYDSDDEYEEGWEGFYAEDGTTISADTNPSYGASHGDMSKEDYWGSGLTSSNFSNRPTAERINESSTVSLRLLALSTTITGFFKWLAQAGFWICNGLAYLATLLISLIVRAKNLSMEMIMNVLHLDDLNDMMMKNFIYNGDTVTLSAFTGFCIIALVFSLAAFTIRWVKGSDKTQGIWEIIGTAFLGLLIIGICLTGRLSSLGSTVSSLANQVMYTAAQAISSSGEGDAFLISVSDSGHETEITQMCEMALVNKAYIDLQLCAQFHVSDVSELKFDNLGDANGVVAKQYLSGVSSANMKKDFNNNLGYYYWFANSSAINKTPNNKTFPTTNTVAVTNKLSSMMTYLQHQYNANISNSNRAELIENITRSFANPTNGNMLVLLVFAVALVIMGLVLLKYALNVVIAKLELFVSLLGMIIAGPLILTANKKLVETGKMILGMLLVSFIEITVYSVIFDIIIYVTSAMFAPKIPNLLAVIAMLLLLWKFNPIIAEKIKRLLEQAERKISPALSDGKRAMKNYARRKAAEKIADYDNKEKIVGYDAMGNAITETRKGDALSRLMHQGQNALLTDAHDHKSAFKIGREDAKTFRDTKNASKAQRRMAAQDRIDKELADVKSDADATTRNVNAEIDATKMDAGQWQDGKLVDINEDGLNDSELEMKRKMDSLNTELDELKNSDRYKKLAAEKAHIDKRNEERLANGEEALQMDEARAKELEAMRAKITGKQMQVNAERKKIEDSITARAAENAFRKAGLDYKGGDIAEELKEQTMAKATKDHAESLERVLTDGIETMRDEVNDLSKTSAKIGGATSEGRKLNRDAATAQAAAAYQLAQLKAGMTVSNTDEAKETVAQVVDNVSAKYDGMRATSEGIALEEAKKNEKDSRSWARSGVDTLDTREHKAAKENLEESREVYKEAKAEVKAQSKQMKKDAKAEHNVGTLGHLTASELVTGGAAALVAQQQAAKSNHSARPNPYQQPQNVGNVVDQRSASRQNAVDNITPPPVAATPGGGAQRTTYTAPQRQTQATPQAAPQRERPNPYQTRNNQAPVQPVSPVEARQAQSRQQQAAPARPQQAQPSREPDVSSIIRNREMQQQTATPPTPEPVQHSRTDSRHAYEQDEARKMQSQAERDFWSDKTVKRPGSRN